MVNLVPVDGYHFCLALPVAFTQTGVHHLAEPCIVHGASVPLKRLCHFNFRRPFEEGRRKRCGGEFRRGTFLGYILEYFLGSMTYEPKTNNFYSQQRKI